MTLWQRFRFWVGYRLIRLGQRAMGEELAEKLRDLFFDEFKRKEMGDRAVRP